MVQLDHLNEAEILHNIRIRYSNDLTFTYIGPTLIAINPYKSITSTVSIEDYFGACSEDLSSKKEQTPAHTFGVAASAFRQLLLNKKNQAIVISGESGAGKTENTKLAMTFLTSFTS